MQPDKSMVRVMGRRRYSVATAAEVASDAFWDGHNWERKGRNTFLMRTPKGNFFSLHMTQWQGEIDRIEPLSQEEAIDLYEQLPKHEMRFEDAFPGVKIEEA